MKYTEPDTVPKCGKVGSDDKGVYRCAEGAEVVRGGRPYCKRHDPERTLPTLRLLRGGKP